MLEDRLNIRELIIYKSGWMIGLEWAILVVVSIILGITLIDRFKDKATLHQIKTLLSAICDKLGIG